MKLSEHAQQLAATVADKAQWGGGVGAFWGWVTSNNVLGVIGVLIALAGFIVNWYYKHKHYKLAEKHAGLAGSDV